MSKTSHSHAAASTVVANRSPESTAKGNRARPAGLTDQDILSDYRIAYSSRQASLMGRREVLTGKAKFGIFGDGKEVAQVALARATQPGDWRSGYYRDQTLMLALGVCTVKQLFAQLYADPDLSHDPMSGGRQMNAHFATAIVADDGTWLSQLTGFNSAADLSPTAAQMGRLAGLGYASKLYRLNPDLAPTSGLFSKQGQEVAFGTIGNASTAEGLFWESLNAAGVLQIPVAISVWDDGFGISVPNRFQMTKESISAITQGFQPEAGQPGVDIYVVKGHDYLALVDTYSRGVAKIRASHAPALFHITELTQPQGHSTSGSHERYKSKERLNFEETHDGLARLRELILGAGIASEGQLRALEQAARLEVEQAQEAAWNDAQRPIIDERRQLVSLYGDLALRAEGLGDGGAASLLAAAADQLRSHPSQLRRTIMASARRTALKILGAPEELTAPLSAFIAAYAREGEDRYSSKLTVSGERSPLQVPEVRAIFGAEPVRLPGNEIIQKCFDLLLRRDPRVFIIGEDVGVLGDVNQNFKGLQESYGDLRITDTGIREATILGQGIGAALRGLRPVVDIQYLDYLLYCFQLLSDDLATLHYRSAGQQVAPVIVRTKGHRLEGIWHTGSPMGTIIHGLRGMHVCVPRDMVQAAGMYNTLFKGDDPALVIEVLSGYRLKEALPENIGEFTVPLGIPEIIRPGSDVTVVTYGACVRIAEEAAALLAERGIEIELIDVRTLLPFDRTGLIGASVARTNAVLFLDEDVPGGASAFMLQQVLDAQGAYEHLDAPPRTLTAKPHRAAYASDGDYWSKPGVEDVTECLYDLMAERDPGRYRPRT